MSTAPEGRIVSQQSDQDNDHLKLLSIFHYVVGGLSCFCACVALIYVFAGFAFVAAFEPMKRQLTENQTLPSVAFGWIFIVLGALFFVVGQIVGISIIMAGRFIDKRIRYTFSFVVSCIECLFMPVGTALGIFTILVLSRDSVKAQFNRA